MLKIALFCSAGMSTSLLVNKIRKEASNQSLECEVQAFPIATAAKNGNDVDVILLGPQVRANKEIVVKACPGIPVECIDMRDYGTLNAKNILKRAKELAGK